MFFFHSGITKCSSLLGCYAGSAVPDNLKHQGALDTLELLNPTSPSHTSEYLNADKRFA